MNIHVYEGSSLMEGNNRNRYVSIDAMILGFGPVYRD